jgi:subtilisin family serine protease
MVEDSNPERDSFNPEVLDRTVIAIPLLKAFEQDADGTRAHPIIIDLHLRFPGGVEKAREKVEALIAELLGDKSLRVSSADGVRHRTPANEMQLGTEQYVFAILGKRGIQELVDRDRKSAAREKSAPAIYHVWPDFVVRRLAYKSISTVKADAAHAAFAAFGQDITWAVIDSGIDSTHAHFAKHKNLDVPPGLGPFDFTGENIPGKDPNGHGTHVAGIIAGANQHVRGLARARDSSGNTIFVKEKIPKISGMAPSCRLVSMRVLNADGNGEVSSIITALAKVQEINGFGRHHIIHGVNLSVGNDFEPEWFACGQSPLCVEVSRLARSGVVVVVAAGNDGYGTVTSATSGRVMMGMSLTINDPGNAELAITVGSTHRDMPHIYGVSYFSSKGPTGDGRIKPDVVAPGEKIISCATGRLKSSAGTDGGKGYDYVENSGTSMAAPHVSGIIAAFLSVRREFIGEPEQVKQIFMTSATDLGRERYFQGKGLVDLMRALQSV